MGCISNGISLYGGLSTIDSTFLVFSDYMKSALRLRAMMGIKNISIFTHDSIAVGEDGATHQPCEQLWALRGIPNSYTFRPANLDEIKASFFVAYNSCKPSNIILSRQKISSTVGNLECAKLGGYIASKEQKGELNGVIIATGSELKIALDVQQILLEHGYNVRIVSMPCVELFLEQTESYQNSIIPNKIKSVFSIEAGSTTGWYKFVGKFGKCYGVDDFGISASSQELYNKFNLTKEFISKDIIKVIKKNSDKILSIV